MKNMKEKHLYKCLADSSLVLQRWGDAVVAAFKQKKGRTVTVVTFAPVVLAVFGYTVYAFLPKVLRDYNVANRVEEFTDGLRVDSIESSREPFEYRDEFVEC